MSTRKKKHTLFLACLGLMALISSASGQWSTDLPRTANTNIPSDTYSVYMRDILKAVGERAELTYTETITQSVWEVQGNTLQLQSRAVPYYDVRPPDIDAFNLEYVYPGGYIGMSLYHYLGWSWYANGGLTNINILPLYTGDDTDIAQLFDVQRVSRQEVIHTNYNVITNYSVATYSGGSITTDIGIVHIGGEFVTNTVYEMVYTNKYPAYGADITGPAYMMFNISQLSDSLGTDPGDASMLYASTIQYSPYAVTQDVTSPRYVQDTNDIATNISIRLWDPAGGEYVREDAVITYTNYTTRVDGLITSEVVSAGTRLVLERGTNDPAAALTAFTPYTKADIDSVGFDPKLMSYASWLILECAPHYMDLSTDYSSTNSWVWRWLDPEDMRPVGAFDTTAWLRQPRQALTTFTAERLLEASGAGTNVRRSAISVNTNNYAYAVDTAWVTPSAGPVSATVPGWQVGNYTTETVSADFDVYTNTIITNLGFNALSDQDMRVSLAEFKTQPLSEDVLVLKGFTRHFWYRNASGEDIYTPQDWLEDLNGLTASNAGVAWYGPTQAYDYYEIGGGPAALIGWPGGWVVVDDYEQAVTNIQNWATLFGTNIVRAKNGFHSYGYPTKAADRSIGWPTLHYTARPEITEVTQRDGRFTSASGAAAVVLGSYPSGQYYPGGTVRPTLYTVGVMYYDRQNIVEDYATLEYSLLAGNDLSGDPNPAQPYWLNRIPVEDLVAWSNTYAVVSTEAPNAIAADSAIDIPMLYRYFDIDSNDVTLGLRNPASLAVNPRYETNVLQVSDLNTNKAIGRRILDLRGTDYPWYTNQVHGWMAVSGRLDDVDTRYEYYVPAVATTLSVDADAVWVSDDSEVVDTYYVAGVTVVTNIEPNATNAAIIITNVTYRPKLVVTNDVLTHDPTRCINLLSVEIVTSNTVSVFDTSIDAYGGSTSDDFVMLTPEAVDARYIAINALKAISVPVQQTIDLAYFNAGEDWETNVRQGVTIGATVDDDASWLPPVWSTNEYTIVSTNGTVGESPYVPVLSSLATNIDWADAEWSINTGGDHTFAHTRGAASPAWSGGDFIDEYKPTKYTGYQEWQYPDWDFSPYHLAPQVPDGPSDEIGLVFVSNEQTIVNNEFKLMDYTNSYSWPYAHSTPNIYFTIDKPLGFSGTVDTYMYVDYVAADFTAVHMQSNSLTFSTRATPAPDYIPYMAYPYTDAAVPGVPEPYELLNPERTASYPDNTPVASVREGSYIGIGPKLVYTEPDILSATNFFTTTNRSLTVPSHEYYPMDSYLTPYVITQYVSQAASTSDTSITASFSTPTNPPYLAPSFLGQTTSYTNIPDAVEVTSIDAWSFRRILPSGFTWDHLYFDTNAWEISEGGGFNGEGIVGEIEYEAFTPLPYTYKVLNVDAVFLPDFVYHD